MNQPLSRRSFIKTTSLASAAIAMPSFLRAQGQSPNQPLNVAIIGVGGIGRLAVEGTRDENIVALCDVDEVRVQRTYNFIKETYPETWARLESVPRFDDYRKMFDRLGNRIDAVTISTPDHSHFPIAMTAMALGKHLYVQKPLTHTIRESRELTRIAKEKRLVTQMGNQGHAGEGCRLLKEWVEAGVLGEVREIHSWTDRPGRYWPHVTGLPDHSKFRPVIPPTLNWDAWLTSAMERPYDPAYVPHDWRGWWEYGTGPFGDVGCHIMDGAYWALNLGYPTAVEAMASGVNEHGSPLASVVTMEFPARGQMPPVKYVWTDGGIMPPLPPDLEKGRELNPEAGTLIFGSKATVLCSFYYDSVRIIPETKMREMAPGLPPRTIPRVDGGPFLEWIRACKGGPKAGSNFDYSGPFSEAVLLGNVALRSKRRIEWDPVAMKVTNLPEANRFITKEYRPGWF